MSRAKVVYTVVKVLAALALTSSAAHAAPAHAAPAHARAKPVAAKARTTPAPKVVAGKAPVKLSAPVASDAPPPALTLVEGKPMTTAELMVEYQRIGRDLMKLQDLRGTECTLELWPRFRAIKLDEMCKTAESRLDLESELKDLRAKIERRRGIELSADCLNNPLAANCQ